MRLTSLYAELGFASQVTVSIRRNLSVAPRNGVSCNTFRLLPRDWNHKINYRSSQLNTGAKNFLNNVNVCGEQEYSVVMSVYIMLGKRLTHLSGSLEGQRLLPCGYLQSIKIPTRAM